MDDGFPTNLSCHILGDEHPFSSPCHGSAEEGQEQSEKESHNKSQPTFEIRGFPGSFNFHMLDFWWVLTSINISPNNDIPDIFCL